LDAQSCIERAEDTIESSKDTLTKLKFSCETQKTKMNDRKEVLQSDIDVLTDILTLTECSSSFVQTDMAIMKCQDPCTHKWFYSFSHKGLKKDLSQLQSSLSHDLVHESLSDLFNGIEGLKAAELLQSDGKYTPSVNETRWKNPPVPRTDVPADPCKDKFAGAPSATDKRTKNCKLGPGQCRILTERFLLIQAGVQDEYDELTDELEQLTEYCKDTEANLLAKISHNQKIKADCETQLAEATKKENGAAEDGRTTAKEHSMLDEKLKTKMKSCSKHYIDYEGELCALKKIRGEVYKLQSAGSGTGNIGDYFFQDCSVSKWSAQDCSTSCGGGEQLLQRNVMVHPNGGAACLPLQMVKTCNAQPCPVNCDLESWTGWSTCSADCGGGVMQRLREVKVAPKYGGRPCSATSETLSCNPQSCDKACVLTDWTVWTTCSKDCDGGTMKRQKFIHEEAQGAGSCPNKWEIDRLEYKACNEFACGLQDASFSARTCNATLDVVLLIDGSGSLGQTGWDAEKKAAALFVDSFIQGGADTQMAVILFSGPSTWGGVFQCTGASAATVDMATVCKITTVTHFNSALATVKSDIQAMVWPEGSTLTSVALMAAKAELTLGRSDAHSIIIVFTDGRPLSKRKTYQAALEVRKAARLVWVPVTSYAPLSDIKQWATRRWQENVVVVKTFEDLEEPEVVTRIIANICPAQLVCQCLECGTGAVGPWQSGACAAGGSGVGLDCKNNVGVAGCYSSLDTHGCFCPGTVDTR
jgi:hypothetical protein